MSNTSGWQGLGAILGQAPAGAPGGAQDPGATAASQDPTRGILNSQLPTGQFMVASDPLSDVVGGKAKTGLIASIASLLA